MSTQQNHCSSTLARLAAGLTIALALCGGAVAGCPAPVVEQPSDPTWNYTQADVRAFVIPGDALGTALRLVAATGAETFTQAAAILGFETADELLAAVNAAVADVASIKEER